MKRAPAFWDGDPGLLPGLLGPVAFLYDAAGRARRAATTAVRVGVPVICIGNLVAGGAGKTPTALTVASWLAARGRAVHFLRYLVAMSLL